MTIHSFHSHQPNNKKIYMVSSRNKEQEIKIQHTVNEVDTKERTIKYPRIYIHSLEVGASHLQYPIFGVLKK